MARIEWRDIAGPNYAPAMQGMQSAAETMMNAFKVAKEGITQFEAGQDQQANSRAALEAASLTTEDQAKAYAQSLLNRPGARRLNTQTINSIADRQNAIIRTEGLGLANDFTRAQTQGQNINNDTGEENLINLKDDRVDFEQKRDTLKEAQPWARRLFTASTNTDVKAGQRDMAAIYASPEFQAIADRLPHAELMALVRDPTSILRGTVGVDKDLADIGQVRSSTAVNNAQVPLIGAQVESTLANADQSRAQSENMRFNTQTQRWMQGNNVVAYADGKAAEGAFQAIASKASDAPTALNELLALGLSDQAFRLAVQLAEPRFPGIVGISKVSAMPGYNTPGGLPSPR